MLRIIQLMHQVSFGLCFAGGFFSSRKVSHLKLLYFFLHVWVSDIWPFADGFVQTAGWWRTACIFIISGVGGTAVSAVFIPYQVQAGATCAVYGIFGSLLIDLVQSWKVRHLSDIMFSRPSLLWMSWFIAWLLKLSFIDSRESIFSAVSATDVDRVVTCRWPLSIRRQLCPCRRFSLWLGCVCTYLFVRIQSRIVWFLTGLSCFFLFAHLPAGTVPFASFSWCSVFHSWFGASYTDGVRETFIEFLLVSLLCILCVHTVVASDHEILHTWSTLPFFMPEAPVILRT